MSATHTSSHAQPASPPAAHEDDDAYYRAVLRDLIERGADLARQLHQRAAEHPEADLTIPFDRIARTIRRTIALARHIAANPPKARPPAADRTQAREKIIRGVEDAIEVKRRLTPGTDTGILYNELHERLDDAAFERDLRTRPIDDIIEELVRDLGIAQQSRPWIWKRRTPADIDALRTRAAAPTYEAGRRRGLSPQRSPTQRNEKWAKAPEGG